MQWTEEQRRVIETRRSNILVSAAAGSGKTAVLVERILSRIMDPADPADIDELLIVTFTRAAAGEMRERIARALAEARDRDPDNEHLARQSTLLPGAMITTIDGFCSYVVRSYGHLVGIAPGFRVAEAGETELMKQDAMQEILEEAYAEEDPLWKSRMTAFAETFASGKNERQMERALFKVAEAADSTPDPEGWLGKCRREYEVLQAQTEQEGAADPLRNGDSGRRIFLSGWMRELMAEAAAEIRLGDRLARENLALTERPEGPGAYRPTAEADAKLFAALSAQLASLMAEGAPEGLTGGPEDGAVDVPEGGAGAEMPAAYDRIRGLLLSFEPVRLSTKKPAEGERPELRDVFKAVRSQLGEIRERLLEEAFPMTLSRALEHLAGSGGPLITLLELVERFRQRFAEKKAARNVLDFSDLEHEALAILRQPTGDPSPEGETVTTRTYAAEELSARFKEVMIDEYQDSNYLQEAILLTISRNELGEQNYFSVGDVKQSIYSFRQARPELFMEKLERYTARPIEGTRIDLHRNFRSRGEVIRAVNGIFRQIMRREIGGVDYDEEAALVQGASYPPAEGMTAELLTIFTEEQDDSGASLLGRVTSSDVREIEARAVGMRIRELMDHGEVFDPKRGCTRPVRYGDIVILLRTMEGWADSFAEVLDSMRIPAYSTAKSGYFTAMEVITVLNYLTIADNPQQDIPFAAVLTSPFCGLGAEELSAIRTADLASSLSGSRARQHVSLYDAARAYAGGGERDGDAAPEAFCPDPALRHRLVSFFAIFDSIRERAGDTPLHELISAIFTETGYFDYVSALPGGAQRALNLRMLVDKAVEYEATSYIGLFNFIRYIENLRKYSQDYGELSTISEQEDVVRISSIHKSKGLEYPIVFVSGMSKSFNLQDLNADLLIHPDLGVAASHIDYVNRVKAPTLKRQAIRRRMLRDNVGEELRVLYVALTRAQQKLIMTGTAAGEDKLRDLTLLLSEEEQQLPTGYIGKCRNYLQWVLPAAERMNARAKRLGLPEEISVRYLRPSDLVVEELQAGIRREDVLTELGGLRREQVYDRRMRERMETRFSWQYPYTEEQIPVEISVSELKREAVRGADGPLAAAEEEAPVSVPTEEAFVSVSEGEEAAPLVPAFYRQAEAAPLAGAMRGTAYHRVLELLDFKALAGLSGRERKEAVVQQIEAMKESGRLTEEEAAAVSPSGIAAFSESRLGRRMMSAAGRGELYREQPFVLGMDASEVHAGWPEGEMVFVQGIVDAYFREGDGLVLVDYKTDRVREERELVERYRVQLLSYARALRQVTALPVRESYIWSFSLLREIPVILARDDHEDQI